jgi:4-amino-4-deoxy-L-arabinose transferase-like glycosyltransferase
MGRISAFRGRLAAVVALALIVRVAVVLATPHYVPNGDATDFDRVAVSLASRGGFPVSVATLHGGPTAFRPPAFPLLLSLAYRVAGVSDASTRWEAGRLLEALLGAIAVWLLALIARRLWNDRVALASSGLAAIYPPLLLVGSSLLSESLFIPAMLGAVLAALVQRDTGRDRWGLVCGLLLAVTALTRSNGAIVVLPLAWLVWRGTGRARFTWRSLRPVAALLGALVIGLVPWTVRNADQFHAFIPTSTEGGLALAGIYNPIAQNRRDYPTFWAPPVITMLHIWQAHPDDNEAQVSAAAERVAVRYIEHHPFSVVRTAFWTTLRLFNLTGTGLERFTARAEGYPPQLAVISVYAFWLVALLAITGVALGAARGAPAAFWWCPAVMLLSTVPFNGNTRYRSPADPWFLILAALALLEGWRRFRAGGQGEEAQAPVPSAAG